MKNRNHEIAIPIGNMHLNGILAVPGNSIAIVIFSHGSGSSRFSPRNMFVAEVLNKIGISTLLIDLLTQEEDSIYENRFDIELLTDRLIAVTNYIHCQPEFKNFRIGYFGASTGAASAINAAERLGELVGAIVSRGGRPDLADVDFTLLKTPVLLIVGGLDTPVIAMNKAVHKELKCEKKIEIVEGATQLFEEESKLEEVPKLASEWFQKFLLKNNPVTTKHTSHEV